MEETADKVEINAEYISALLVDKGLVRKQFGLCAEPFEMYFEVCHTDQRGVSSVKNPLNTIWVNLTHHATRKKRFYFHGIEITKIEGMYHICCLAQTSYYNKGVVGPDHVVYKVEESDIPKALDIIFKDVETN